VLLSYARSSLLWPKVRRQAKEDYMRLSTTSHLLGSTTLILVLATPSCLALAATSDVVRSGSGAAATSYGRAGGQAYFSTAQPPRTPQALTDAYETTKGFVEHAYEKSKELVVESAQGSASKEQAAQTDEVGANKPVTSGAAIDAFGRAGTQSSLNTAEPRQPPQLLSNAYEKTKASVKHAYESTKEFLTESTQRSTTEHPASLSGT
jgi:hypothetical protein